jgi:propanol-preferring alcohol dehydrogenase
MKAMLLDQPAPIGTNPLRLVDIREPEPGPGMLRIRVEACGICRTDLHIVEGELPPLGSSVVPGHQVVGRVDKLGPGARRFLLGTRVGIAWHVLTVHLRAREPVRGGTLHRLPRERWLRGIRGRP